MKTNRLDLFTTTVGSHMWKMETPTSDIDLQQVYMMDSKKFILERGAKGKFVQTKRIDKTTTELGSLIYRLLEGNCNNLWCVMSPIINYEYKSALKELREIVSKNLARNCFNSIEGMARGNIARFITKGDRYSDIYKKKLNIVGRNLKFGINILTWGKCMFDKADIKNEDELLKLKNKLNIACLSSVLPDKPNPKPFEKYLIKWRLHKMKLDEII